MSGTATSTLYRRWGFAQPEVKGRNAYWLELPGLHCKWFTHSQHHEAQTLHAAHEMALNAVKAYQLRKHAEGQLECYKSNTNAPEKRKAEETAA